MNRGTLPCTALSMTRNNAGTLEPCLRSSLFCREHLILDGGSTDGTLELAAEYGCKVVQQSQEFLDATGRIINYGGVMNQGIALAEYPWIFNIDSDELLDQECILEIQKCVMNDIPSAFFANRFYSLNGRIIRYASAYPNEQIRLFHREAIEGFIKMVHERALLKPGIQPSILSGVMYVPLDTIAALRGKSLRYLEIERKEFGAHGWIPWLFFTWNKFLRMGLRILRIGKIRLFHRWSDCLPLSYEWLNIWYPWGLILKTCPLWRKHRPTEKITR